MRRLHFGLRRAGIDSKILCVREVKASPHIIISKPSYLERKWNSITGAITHPFGLEDVLNINAIRIKKNKAYRDADIINFHRIPNVFSYLAIPALTRNKPSVFTLCEMWGLTGHCRYSFDCERWQTGCGNCPYTNWPPVIRHDRTHFQWLMKKWVYRFSKLTIVAKSKWMVNLAKKSILNHFRICHIPNGIDTDVYKPLGMKKCRAMTNIPSGKKIIMFVAQRFDAPPKGGDLLFQALKGLPKSLKRESVVLAFGGSCEFNSNDINIPIIHLGYIEDDHVKSTLYSAADIFVCPSRSDNFPNVVLESMACGTPVVAFGVTGLTDLVRPGLTGYLAEPEDADSFRDKITALFEDDYLRRKMGQNCREMVINEYSLETLFNRYIKLYRQVIGKMNSSNK